MSGLKEFAGGLRNGFDAPLTLADRSAVLVAIATVAGVLIGAMVAARGAVVPLALCLAPVLAYAAWSNADRSLAIAAGAIILLPSTVTLGTAQLTFPRLAVALGGIALLTRARIPWRISIYDVAVVVIVAGWLLMLGPEIPRNFLINSLLPVAMYCIARVVDDTRRVLCVLAIGGGLSALGVFFEGIVVGHPLFVDASTYFWTPQRDATLLFRPGWVFGSPPGASVVLAMTAVCALPLLYLTGWRRWLIGASIALAAGAVVLTFTRASLIGMACGAIFFLFFSPIRPSTRAWIVAAIAVALAAFVVALPALEGHRVYQLGIARPGTFGDRTQLWRTAFPIAADSAQHLVAGHGFGAILLTKLGAATPADLASAPSLMYYGPHNLYIRVLVENGVVGLVPLLMLGSLPIAALVGTRGVALEQRREILGLASALVVFEVSSLANDTLRHLPSAMLMFLLAGLLVNRLTTGATAGA